MGKRLKIHIAVIAIVLFVLAPAFGQSGGDRCALNGTYRIDIANSDRLYSVVRDAQSSVPFGDQQQFFMDLSTRLTPPDMLAIECRGQQVSVGSSRANTITYLADGRNRRERSSDGSTVNSKVTLVRDSLTFVSLGRAEDNVNVAFESIDRGRKLRVTRRIYAAQLADPIIIRTVYDKIAPGVDWNINNSDRMAGRNTTGSAGRPGSSDDAAQGNGIDALRGDFVAWLDATNRRDIAGQMRFYMPQMRAYYLTRNVPSRTVRLEKERIFGAAREVDIRAEEPEIVLQDQGRTAVMRFVKAYNVTERSRTRRGTVIQELRWQRTREGWLIFSERDVRVIR